MLQVCRTCSKKDFFVISFVIFLLFFFFFFCGGGGGRNGLVETYEIFLFIPNDKEFGNLNDYIAFSMFHKLLLW